MSLVVQVNERTREPLALKPHIALPQKATIKCTVKISTIWLLNLNLESEVKGYCSSISTKP